MQQVKNLYSLIRVRQQRRASLNDPELKSIIAAWLQAAICWGALLPFGGVLVLLMKHAKGYQIENLKEIRNQFRSIWKETTSPLIICANHLTFIDSALIIWALASNLWYVRNYKAFTWNLPAGDVFKKKFRYHLTLYLTKCIFIHRDGSNEHKNAVLGLCRYLLSKGNVVLIFPEGQRSRKNVFDDERVMLGVGKVIESLGDCRVLCIHLRSDKQETYSDYPPIDSRFRVSMKLIKPATMEKAGKRAHLDFAQQIGTTIKQLEDEYFAQNKIEQQS